MNLIEIIMTSIAMGVDASAVSISNGLAYPNTRHGQILLCPLFFGIFQGLMPVLGYYFLNLLPFDFGKYSDIAVFFIFAALGLKMLFDALLKREDKSDVPARQFGLKLVLIQAVATSIDAFALGVGLSAKEGINIFSAAGCIAVITAVMSVISLFIGKSAGKLFGKYGAVVGGIILMALAIKQLLYIF